MLDAVTGEAIYGVGGGITVESDAADEYDEILAKSRILRRDPSRVLMLDLPETFFEMPETTGRHRFDELVRLPDYLAGTLADYDFAMLSSSKETFDVVMKSVYVNSPNNWIVQLASTEQGVVARTVGLTGTL